MRSLTIKRVDFSAGTGSPNARMRLEVTAAEGMPAEVFVYRRVASEPVQDVFAAVAVPVQMEDLPTNEPTAPGLQHFRTAQVDLVAGNADLLESLYREVMAELALLIRNLNSLDDAVSETITVIDSEGGSATGQRGPPGPPGPAGRSVYVFKLPEGPPGTQPVGLVGAVPGDFWVVL